MATWLTGFHSVEESIKSGITEATLYISTKGARSDKLIRLAQKKGIPFRNVTRQKIQALSGDQRARDCALQTFQAAAISSDNFEKDSSTTLEEFLDRQIDRKDEKSTVLILDSITDPHNLGAILRSADQFNVGCVLIPQRGSAKESATVMKTSAGAARYVKSFIVPNLKRSIELLKKYEYWVYGANMGGDALNKTSFAKKSVIIMGSEGKGMRPLIADACDSIISIPTTGHIDSLNVSVACGIILYEIQRS